MRKWCIGYHNFEDTKTIKLLINLNKIGKLYNIGKSNIFLFLISWKRCRYAVLARSITKIQYTDTCTHCIYLFSDNYNSLALLAVHTNQKRFQCERPREKRAVLRERKEALGSPVHKVDRVEGRSWFQSEGLMIAKARVWAIEVLACGTESMTVKWA